MTEAREGPYGENPSARSLQISLLGSLNEASRVNFGFLVSGIGKELPYYVKKDSWQRNLKQLNLTLQNRIKLYDASAWAYGRSQDQRFDKSFNLHGSLESLGEAITESFSPEQLKHLASTELYRRSILASDNQDEIRKWSKEIGINPESIKHLPYPNKERSIYAKVAADLEKIGKQNQDRQENQSGQEAPRRRFDQMRDSFMNLLNASTGINFKLAFDSDSRADVAWGLGRNYWEDIITRFTEPEDIKLFDIYHLAKDLMQISGDKFSRKPNFTVSINSLEQALQQHFSPEQVDFLNNTYQARIALLSTDYPEAAQKHSEKLNIPYEIYIKDKPYQTMEGIIYGLTSQEIKNLSSRKERESANQQEHTRQEQRYKDRDEDPFYRSYQKPPAQENEKPKPPQDEVLAGLLKGTPQLDPEVYKNYREGDFGKGRPKIQDFDKLVQVLLKTGGLTLDENDHIFTFSHNVDPAIKQKMQELVETWGTNPGPKSGEILDREMVAATERVYLHHLLRTQLPDDDKRFEDPNKLSKYFGSSTADVLENPGVILGLGLVLTNGTRKAFTGKQIDAAFNKIMKMVHPDVNRNDPLAGRKTRKVMAAKEMLLDEARFRDYSKL